MSAGTESCAAGPPTVVMRLLRWVLFGAVAGVLAGVSSRVFLAGLEAVTQWREEGRQFLLAGLPLAGLVMAWLYHTLGGRSHEGTNLLLDEIHQPRAWVPRRMAPLVLVGTWVSHLFGASVGREGTAVQMSGSLSDGFARLTRMTPEERRIMLVAALSAGFGAVFGVPWAGAVFGLEVQALGRRRWAAVLPAVTGSVVGNAVMRGLRGHHTEYAVVRPDLDLSTLGALVLAGVVFGVVGAGYPVLTHALKKRMARWFVWPPWRPFVGGVATIALVVAFGHQYQGLSLPLLADAMSGAGDVSAAVFALKFVFTVVAVGSGFFGGEVTPLFVIGATLGSALATPLGVSPVLLAAVGLCAVFAASANAPLTCVVMGVELFGWPMVVPLSIGCLVAYAVSWPEGLYHSQRSHHTKLVVNLRRLREASPRG